MADMESLGGGMDKTWKIGAFNASIDTLILVR